jgi:hypothetical protein
MIAKTKKPWMQPAVRRVPTTSELVELFSERAGAMAANPAVQGR